MEVFDFDLVDVFYGFFGEVFWILVDVVWCFCDGVEAHGLFLVGVLLSCIL